MLYLSHPFARTREPDKIMAITDIQIHIVTAYEVTKQFYKTSRQSIWKLVAPARVFCMESSPCKYPYHPIIRHFAPVIQMDCNKPCGLAYKVN